MTLATPSTVAGSAGAGAGAGAGSPLRILIVSAYFPPHVGGVEVVAQQQARSLAAAGHAVVVVTTRSDPALPQVEGIDGYTVVRLPANNLFERRANIPYPLVGPRFCKPLRRLVARCDAVHVHDILYQPSQIAAVLARAAAKPLYATAHVGLVDHDRAVVRGIQHLSTLLAGRYIWRHAARVVTHNHLVYEHVRAHRVPAERITLAPSGIDTAQFTPGSDRQRARTRRLLLLSPAKPVVLFVGRLVAKKGYRQLLDAAEDDYHLVLAGPGQPPRPLPPSVRCLGPVSRDELIELYRLADLFVLPAVGEIFTLAMQEAMACGVPVITTDDPQYHAYGVDSRLLRLVAPDPGSLRVAMRGVLADPGLRRQMSQYSRQLAVQFFDWHANQAPLLRLYHGTG